MGFSRQDNSVENKIHSPGRAIDLDHPEDVELQLHEGVQVFLNISDFSLAQFTDKLITLVARANKRVGEGGT